MIIYLDESNRIAASQLQGFFVGWKKTLSAQQHCALLYGSTHFIAAINDETAQVVGFVTALSDGIASSFIPLLEVLPDYQGKGIGTRLMEGMLQKLDGIPNVDLSCDAKLQSFYVRFNMLKSHGMVLRKYSD
jgi:ribosomal protein S18 acetylase RimI-like enzyme